MYRPLDQVFRPWRGAVLPIAASLVAVASTACSDGSDPLAPSSAPISIAAAKGGRPSSIAFTVGPYGSASIGVVKSNGKGLKTLVNSSGADRQAAYSPDGQWIAFVSDRSGTDQIYVSKADGRDPAAVTDLAPGEFPSAPAWSPGGTRIAFSRAVAGNVDIYAIDRNGGGLERLTDAAAADEDPAWSPDGSRIAFVSRRDGNAEVYLMSADGSDETPFTACVLHCYGPAWSPDGQTIAYQSGSQLQTQAVAGGNPVQVAVDLDELGTPAWSADGSELVFVGFEGSPQRDLFAVHPDGSGKRRITNTAEVESYPSWKE